MAITIVKGSDAGINVSIKDKESGDPFDLTGLSGASAFMPGDASTVVIAGTPLGSLDCGRLKFDLSDSDTNLLAAGDGANMEVVIDIGANRTIVQFEGVIDVKPRLF